MNFQLSLKRAVTELLVLKLLELSDLSCFQCAKRIKNWSNGSFVITESLLFPVFQHMNVAGYISWYGLEGHKQQIFHLEEAGRAYLRQSEKEYYDITREVTRFLHLGSKPKHHV